MLFKVPKTLLSDIFACSVIVHTYVYMCYFILLITVKLVHAS